MCNLNPSTPSTQEEPTVIEEIVRFPVSQVRLEGTLHYDPNVEAKFGVLVASPHPHFAGNRDNNVVSSLAAGLAGHGGVTFRFDYRGVMDETGLPEGVSSYDYWTEVEEKQDYSAAETDTELALEFLVSVTGEVPIAIAGYSFGAAVGGKVAVSKPWVKALACIAPPVDRVNFSFLTDFCRPCIWISGANDFAASVENLDRVFHELSRPKRRVILEQADHFFRGSETNVVKEVREFILPFLIPEV